MAAAKKIKEYIDRSMRKIKHRKGYGVHSPFAFDIITQVIEEKLPYYAYKRMQRTYGKQAPMAFKVACLILRLANRFHVRRSLEVGCDGGYTLLPLLLVDHNNMITSVASPEIETQATERLAWTNEHMKQLTFAHSCDEVTEAPDFMMINDIPAGMTEEAFAQWIMDHTHEKTVLLVRYIQPRHRLERVWDMLCDNEDLNITMDLYDYGLAIRRPRFFKQHYTVSF